MTLFGNQLEAVKTSAQLLASTFLDRIAALASIFLIPAILGASYLGMSIATSIARRMLELATGTPRKI